MTAPTLTATRPTQPRIEALWQDSGGHWCARVRAGEAVVELTDEHGSWQTPALDARGRRKEARPAVAAALQRELRRRG
jgi:hypothetical protein